MRGSMLLVNLFPLLGTTTSTVEPSSEGTLSCFIILNSLLLVSTKPPRRQAEASSNAPVSEAPQCLDAEQLASNTAFGSFLFLKRPKIDSTIAVETALELLSPTAMGISDSIFKESEYPFGGFLMPRCFNAYDADASASP